MKDIRELHEFKLSVLNPLSDRLSRECGPASLSHTADDPQTICEDPETSLLYVAMFGDFFAASVQAVYDPAAPEALSPRIRRDWWEQCCTDVYCDKSPITEQFGPLQLNMRSINEIHYSESWRDSWLIACARYAEESGIYFRESTGDPEQDFEAVIRKERIWEQTLKGSGLLSLEMMLDRELPWEAMEKLITARELISKMDSIGKVRHICMPWLGLITKAESSIAQESKDGF
ncbi:hypothetical protein BP6252_00303 [Coleophoma cylindrospora]|uniref:Uncharacterized protein n=1 Tax=Coleophoma cylindrospora TaxID=1849047 RepID=A0A3D8SQ28_9HELO|nr:hypothetical protein BP6252_00303 [Coleophoma cylindrospora]